MADTNRIEATDGLQPLLDTLHEDETLVVMREGKPVAVVLEISRFHRLERAEKEHRQALVARYEAALDGIADQELREEVAEALAEAREATNRDWAAGR
jgi:PHD/YefM family antitoxin component YafN of YafNO toxin-antitoxin module